MTGVTEPVRPDEWARLRAFVLAERSGPASLALVGEPVAGKSTLWRTAVDTAREAGHRVLRSEPSVAEADLPFAGVSDPQEDGPTR